MALRQKSLIGGYSLRYYFDIELKSMFALLFVFAVRLSTCHNLIDVEYSDEIVSDHKSDSFGESLATSHHKLVIGAPWDDNLRG